MPNHNDLVDRKILLWCKENLANGRRLNTEVQVAGTSQRKIISRIEDLARRGYITLGEERVKELGHEAVYYIIELTEKGKGFLEQD